MRKNGKKALTSTRTLSRNTLAPKRRISAAKSKRLMLGRYIVADPKICHGKPTIRGTRIMVSQVLEQVALGMDWVSISERWGGSIPKEAIAEAVRLSSQAFLEHAPKYVVEPIPA
jgi:uncharacterized protein (DUF433 family)